MQLRRIPLQLINKTLTTEETVVSHLQKCRSLKCLRQIHAQIVSNGLHAQNYVAVKLVSCCKSLGNIAYARVIFNGSVDSANIFLWTAMIAAYSQQRSPDTGEAISLFRSMLQYGVQPNSYTLSSVLKACSFLAAAPEGTQIHVHAMKLGLNSDLYVQTTMMDMYANLGCIRVAAHLFETMAVRNLVVCNAMIVCYTKAGCVKAARDVFDEMPRRDSISWAAMISGYANDGSMEAAQELFSQLPERDVAAWNALITGYSYSGDWHRALELFDEMQLEKVKPNQVTMAVVISVCGQLGALDKTKCMHRYLKGNDMEINVHVFNSLIDTYAKCGSIDEAFGLFCEMSLKDVVSYNAMIVGFANHGNVGGALRIFTELLESGIQPDRITFLGVLTVCSHAGLLDVGHQFFNSMTKDYEIKPSVDHYACMVDLLGRAGFIQEAYKLVKAMEVEPHAGVWGALLNACRVHCNVEVGKIAAEKLFEIEPENPGNYVLLSNIYARAQMWTDAARVRHWMRGRGVPKTEGCSWIEVGSRVHKFWIGDANNPQCLDIYFLLRHLSLELAMDG